MPKLVSFSSFSCSANELFVSYFTHYVYFASFSVAGTQHAW